MADTTKNKPTTTAQTTNSRLNALGKRIDDANMRCDELERRIEKTFETTESRMAEIEKVIERLSAGKSWWGDAKKRLGSK